MKQYRFVKFVGLWLLCAMMFVGCKQGDRKIEVTNYVNGTVETLSRKLGVSLMDLGSGNFSAENILHVNATNNRIISVTLQEQATNMQMFQVSIGMSKDNAEKVLKETFKEAPYEHMTGDEGKVTNIYHKEDKDLKVTYDTNTNEVVELTLLNKENEDVLDIANNGDLAVIVGGTKVYYNEAMVYLKSIQQDYEADYGNEIWSSDILGDGHTFGGMMKDEIMKQIIDLKIISAKAAELNITLSEEELAAARKMAREHYAAINEEDITKYHFSQELFVNVYNDNMLAEKVYETVTLNVDTQVPDFEANQRTIQHIFIKNYKIGESGTEEPLSNEEKTQAYEKMEELRVSALETENFYKLAEGNTQDDTIETTFGRLNPVEGYPEEFLTAAYSLKTGEVSNIITTDNGWYLLYCVTDYNEDATIALKEDIIEQRRSKMFSDLYTEWSADFDIVVNSETWKSMQFD